jgi:hypothetical protein
MSDVYRIYGAELSPFSVKIRSYFRYKQIPQHRSFGKSIERLQTRAALIRSWLLQVVLRLCKDSCRAPNPAARLKDMRR